MAKKLVIGLCSGGIDKLTAAGIIIGGAIADDMQIEIYVLLNAARSFKKEFAENPKRFLQLSEHDNLRIEFIEALEYLKIDCCIESFRKAKEMGYTANAGPEYEFFLLNMDEKGNPVAKPSDSGGYFDLMRDSGDNVRKEIVMYLNKMGFDVEASHHEVAPGQHEIDLTYSDIITSADRVTMMKYVTKIVALKHSLYATFMPKPFFGENGSGMHVHLSLIKRGENTFYEKKGRYELSKNAFYFIGGLLRHAKETCAVLASCVNSYKRLVPGYEAPVYLSWANRNRSALIRVPAGREMKTRVEVRNPDPAGNPYLQFAVMLASGLKGVEEKIVPPEPVEKDIYRMTNEERKKHGIGSLPSNLGEALYYMEKSALVKEIIGEHLFKHYLYIKHKEWDEYRRMVTGWEIEKLLPIL